jgi:hypothetical protein
MRAALMYLIVVFFGAVVAVVGAIGHRSIPWLGIAMCLALVLVGAVFSRAWLGWGGIAAFAAPWTLLTFVFSQPGPGDSTLIVADSLGYTWLLGGTALIVVTCFIPSSVLGGAARVEAT